MLRKKRQKKKGYREDDESIFLVLTTLGMISLLVVVVYFSSEYTFWEKLALQTRQFKKNDAISLLSTDNPELLEQSFWQIELIGENAVPGLLEVALDDSRDEQERLNAIYALGRLKKNGVKAVNNLVGFLRHGSANMRGVTVRALAKIGDESAVFSIEPLLNDKDRWVREGAQWALSTIKSKDAREILKQHQLDGAKIPDANDKLRWLEGKEVR